MQCTSTKWWRKLFAVVMALALTWPVFASAEPWDEQADKATQIFQGGFAKKIAVLVVVCAGLMCLRGKLPLQWFICIMVGVLLMAKSEAVVSYLW